MSVVCAFKYCPAVKLLLFRHSSMRYKTERSHINHAVSIVNFFLQGKKIYIYKRETCNFQSYCTEEVHFLNNSWEKVANFVFWEISEESLS